MAMPRGNEVWNGWKQLVGRHGIGIAQAVPPGTFKVGLLNVTYDFSQGHDMVDDLGGALVASQLLVNATFNSKKLRADNLTFPSLSGPACGALLLFMDTGTASSSRLFAYLDTGIIGLPFTPTGADVNLVWDVDGIMDL